MLIALTICTTLAQPTCTDERIPLTQVFNSVQCLRDGPAVLAEYMTQHHPDERVSAWKCVASDRQERRS